MEHDAQPRGWKGVTNIRDRDKRLCYAQCVCDSTAATAVSTAAALPKACNFGVRHPPNKQGFILQQQGDSDEVYM